MRNVGLLVKKVLVENLGVDEAEVTPEASISDDLGADSLDCVELVIWPSKKTWGSKSPTKTWTR